MQLRVSQLLIVIRSNCGQIELPEVAHNRHVSWLKDIRNECESNEVYERPQRAVDYPRGNEGLLDLLERVDKRLCVTVGAQSEEQEILLCREEYLIQQTFQQHDLSGNA